MDHEEQARQFLAWHERKGGTMYGDFSRWAESKDFAQDDRGAIWTLVVRMTLPLGWHGVDPVC